MGHDSYLSLKFNSNSLSDWFVIALRNVLPSPSCFLSLYHPRWDTFYDLIKLIQLNRRMMEDYRKRWVKHSWLPTTNSLTSHLFSIHLYFNFLVCGNIASSLFFPGILLNFLENTLVNLTHFTVTGGWLPWRSWSRKRKRFRN